MGHESNVRALVWHSEIPWLLFTGGWDATIKVWDTRAGRCMFTSYDHHSDVYGIAFHPETPFILASCSRDNTVRFWSIQSVLEEILVHPQVIIDEGDDRRK